MKIKLKDSGIGGSLKENLLVISDYPDYEMCCLKRKMSAPMRLIDSKAWCPLSFHLKYCHCNGNRRQKQEENHKSEELSEK